MAARSRSASAQPVGPLGGWHLREITQILERNGGAASLGKLMGNASMKGVRRSQLESHFDVERTSQDEWEIRLRRPASRVGRADVPRRGRGRGAVVKVEPVEPPIGHGPGKAQRRRRPPREDDQRECGAASDAGRRRGRRSRSRSRSRNASRRQRCARSRSASRTSCAVRPLDDGRGRSASIRRAEDIASFADRLASRLRDDDTKGACRDAQETVDRDKGLLCISGVVARLRANVERLVSAERARLLGQVEAVVQALDAQSAVPHPLVSKLTPDQRLRADVLARHVARLGSRGEGLERSVRQASCNDPRWHITGAEYESVKERARLIFMHGARPAADDEARMALGVGGSAGGLCSAAEEPREAGPSEARAKRHGENPSTLPISDLYWSHDKISEAFREQGSILELVVSLLSGTVDPASVPPNRVICHKRQWHLLSGNRRLAAWRLASFFEPRLLSTRVSAEQPKSSELNKFLTGGGSGKPQFSTKQNRANCDGRWVRMMETEEVIGRVLTADTYGCDLLWLLFRPNDPFPPSAAGERNFLRWRPRFAEAFSAHGTSAESLVEFAARAEAKRIGVKGWRSFADEVRKSIPPGWLKEDYVWLPSA